MLVRYFEESNYSRGQNIQKLINPAKTESVYLQHLHLHRSYSILNPSANFRVSALPHWIVIFASLEERRPGVDVSFIEDCVDSDSEEVTKGQDHRMVRIESCAFLAGGRHSREIESLGSQFSCTFITLPSSRSSLCCTSRR